MIYPVVGFIAAAEPPKVNGPVRWDREFFPDKKLIQHTSHWVILGEPVVVMLRCNYTGPYWHLYVANNFVYTFHTNDYEVAESRATELLLNSSYLPKED